MKKYLLCLSFLLISLQDARAQPTLVLRKYRSARKYQFKEGEVLKLELKNSREVLRGSWQAEDENIIALDGQLVSLREIAWINIAKKEKGIWPLRKGRDLLILAGLGFLAVAQVNSFLQPEKLAVEHKVYVNSTRLVAGGLDRMLRQRKARIGRKYKIHLRT